MKKSCCDMRGLLSFLILFMVTKKPMHGQEIAIEIERRKGCKPSPGTIYPALKHLHKQGFIKEKKDGRNIVYEITLDGKRAFDEAKKQFCQTFSDVL
ncbi:MAG: PadR family transcriptional regulator [Nanoarchaeota archaeon]